MIERPSVVGKFAARLSKTLLERYTVSADQPILALGSVLLYW